MGILKCRDLEFKDLLSYPDIDIEEGSFSFVVGPSGVGKSVLLRLLNRTHIPSKGKILYEDRDIRDMDVIDYRKEVLLVPQEVYLFDTTIRENFEKYYSYRNEPSPDDKTIRDFMDLTLADFDLDTMVTTLSGGQRQRVFLSIFLSTRPEVVLLDEPTSALDEATSKDLFLSLDEIRKKQDLTIIAVSHNDDLVREFSDATINLGDKK